jgi:8-oxo-dGTP diphosphatase
MRDRRLADQEPGSAPIRAAGAVLWRRASNGIQVALIHRPKYDDWGFPKGKLDPGEHVLLAAVREVGEETGLQVTLGRPLRAIEYDNAGVPKRVDYWVGQAEAVIHEFSPNREVDQLKWIAASKPGARLTYQRDIETLADVRGGPVDTAPLILVRHASAGSKAGSRKDDLSRPLDADGKRDAKQLASLLRCFGTCRVISSPAERAIATVRPYEKARVEVEVETAIGVTKDDCSEADAQVAKVASLLAADERPVIICAHRENMPALLAATCHELGAPNPAEAPLRKGEFLVLHRAAGKLAGVERHSPAGGS